MIKPQKKWSFLAVSLVLFIIACSNPGSPGPATYRVTYDANGGTGSVPTDAHSYAQAAIVTVPGNTGNMAKPGYFTGCSFAGWNTKADGSGTSYAEGTTFSVGSADVILYCVWLDAEYAFTSSGTSIVITGNNISVLHSRAISGGVTRIGENAFHNCQFLDLINIPSSVTSIGQSAFQDCTTVLDIEILSTVPAVLGSNAFAGCPLLHIDVPAGTAATYKNASGWSDYASIIR